MWRAVTTPSCDGSPRRRPVVGSAGRQRADNGDVVSNRLCCEAALTPAGGLTARWSDAEPPLAAASSATKPSASRP